MFRASAVGLIRFLCAGEPAQNRHSGIATFSEKGGTIRKPPSHSRARTVPRTTKIYDRASHEITFDDAERICDLNYFFYSVQTPLGKRPVVFSFHLKVGENAFLTPDVKPNIHSLLKTRLTKCSDPLAIGGGHSGRTWL